MSDGASYPHLLKLYQHRPRSRSDWSEIRGRIDLTKVAAALLGPPVERRGLTSGSLGWCCPFDDGTSASFRVILGEAVWSCSACEAGGDAAALVMRLKSISFCEAIAWLDEQEGLDSSAVVASDFPTIPQAMTGREFRLATYDIGECAVIVDFAAGPSGKVDVGAAGPR
jgi:DNA primase